MTNDQSKLKLDFEEIFGDLIEKHDLTLYGESIEPTVDRVDDVVTNSVVIYFEDEGIASLIAGYAPARIYDEMENAVNNLGFDIVDTNGCELTVAPRVNYDKRLHKLVDFLSYKADVYDTNGRIYTASAQYTLDSNGVIRHGSRVVDLATLTDGHGRKISTAGM